VLVVDDEPDAREALRLILEAHGAAVTVAGSVRDAMRMLDECVPDVVVSDIHLPDEDGYALVRALRASDRLRRLPAIAVTGFDGPGEGGRAIAAGYQMRLAKPVEPELLVTAISRLAAHAAA
jgi:CheY-like chemotaxis protein